MSVPGIPPSQCTNDYMPWYLCRTHLRIHNPDRLPHSVHQYLAPSRPTPIIVLGMLAPFIDPDIHDVAGRYRDICLIMEEFHLRTG